MAQLLSRHRWGWLHKRTACRPLDDIVPGGGGARRVIISQRCRQISEAQVWRSRSMLVLQNANAAAARNMLLLVMPRVCMLGILDRYWQRLAGQSNGAVRIGRAHCNAVLQGLCHIVMESILNVWHGV